jgi:hypothetical protein
VAPARDDRGLDERAWPTLVVALILAGPLNLASFQTDPQAI